MPVNTDTELQEDGEREGSNSFSDNIPEVQENYFVNLERILSL